MYFNKQKTIMTHFLSNTKLNRRNFKAKTKILMKRSRKFMPRTSNKLKKLKKTTPKSKKRASKF